MEPVDDTSDPDGGDFHVLATPLLQISSVCIQAHSDDGRPFEIYGSVRAIEAQGTTIDLYDRDLSQSETLLNKGTLSLIGPQDDSILASRGVTVDLCLKDRTRNIELIRKQHSLDFATEDSYDKLMMAVIQGEHGNAFLYYTAFRFAVSAFVEVRILEKDVGSGDVYGTLVAFYGNNGQYCDSDDELKYLDTVLFEKPSDQPVEMMVGTRVKLLRSVVAVPAYSSLVIKADLFESQGHQFVSGLVEFPADECGDPARIIQSENGCIQVKVKFMNAYPRIYKKRQLSACTTLQETPLDRENNTEEPSKKAPALDIRKQHLPSSLNLEGIVPQTQTDVSFEYRDGDALVEVFSVYIGGINHEVSTICGTIKYYATFRPICIYDRNSNDPEVLLDDEIASIEHHFAIRNPELLVATNLKDPIQNLQVSRGEISWSSGSLNSKYQMSWFDKRICSVVRGADGYVAVHYMIINSAVIANVEVAFFCDNSGGVAPNLYGTLFAFYSGHEYYTDYEKKYYRSRLFNRPRNKPADLSTCSKVPLLKSIVAVPTESSLIIEANLYAICNDDSQEEAVYGTKEFPIDLFDMSRIVCEEIRGEFCRVEVSVKFEHKFYFR